MIFLFLTLMAVITVVVLAKSKEIYFVSASFKRSKSFLLIQIFQVLVIYLGLIFADYSNKIFFKLQYEIEQYPNLQFY